MTGAAGEWDYAHTAAARVNRVVKAEHLADAIVDLGHLPDVDERRGIVRQLGLRGASDETWALAVEIYRERHEVRG